MTLSKFKEHVDWLCETGHADDVVLVTLADNSVGSRASASVTGVHAGFDFEAGQIRISTDRKIISFENDRDKGIKPIRKDFDIGSRMRHLLICPKCENHLRKDDNYCSRCGQKMEK